MIKINRYEPQTVEHFDSENNSLGFLNEQESTDLRCQIAEQKAEGYYLIFNGFNVGINNKGMIHDWKNGLYETNEILLSRLFRAQRLI